MTNNLMSSGRVLFFIIFTTAINNIDCLETILNISLSHDEVIEINEGDSLLVTCDYEIYYNINYPRDDPMNGIFTSPHEITSERYYNDTEIIWNTIKWKFYRKNVVFGDTGSYSCHRRSKAINAFDVFKVYYGAYYVYVKSEKHLFVHTKQNNSIIVFTDDDELLIPCRPTSPDLHVDLINVHTNTKVALDQNNTYDPKIGFLLEFSLDLDRSLFKCRIENDSKIEEIFYHVIVDDFLEDGPSINNKDDYRFGVVGETLRINCSFTVSAMNIAVYLLFISETNPVEAVWITPRNMSLRKVQQYNEIINDTSTKTTLELLVENVTMSDTGLYTCQLNYNFDEFDTGVDILYIEVHEAIEVTGLLEPITKHDDLQIACNSWLGQSTKSIEWFKRSQVIVDNERISVEHRTFNHTPYRSAKSAILNIKDIGDSDIARYFCIVTRYQQQTVPIVVPIDKLNDPKAPKFNDTNLNNNSVILLRPIKEVQYLYCNIIGMPPPTVAWYKNNKLIENVTRDHEEWNYRSSMFLFDFKEDISANYSCIGTNRLGRTERRDIEIIAIDHSKIPSMVWISLIVSLMFIIIILIIYTSCKISSKKARNKALQEIGLVCADETHLQTLHLNWNTDEQIQQLPFSEKWEISIKKLKLGKQLGQGDFGVVLKAEAQNILDEDSSSTVSVKLVSRKADPIHMKSIVNELKILIYVGKHLNLLNLLGVCTDKIVKKELLLILEYSCFGNIRDYLMCHRKNFINEVDPSTGKIVPFVDHTADLTPTFGDNTGYKSEMDKISNLENIEILKNSSPGWRSKYFGDYNTSDIESIFTRDLLSWSYQIACAMDHLSSKRVIHGDLALENVLLTQNNVVKLCDIGVARTLLGDQNYKENNRKNLPLKWMAIESINQTRCSLESDVWSFGVVLWELFTLGEIPYGDMPNGELYEKLLSGYRLEKPKYSIEEIYETMLECWQEDSNMRPTFANLMEQIGALLDGSVLEQIVRMNDSYAEKRVQFVSEDIHLDQTSSLDFENATISETDSVMETTRL